MFPPVYKFKFPTNFQFKFHANFDKCISAFANCYRYNLGGPERWVMEQDELEE
jgi:hypothetical protein